MPGCDIHRPLCGPDFTPYAAPGDAYQFDIYWIVDQLRRLTEATECIRRKTLENGEEINSLNKDQCATNAQVADLNSRLDNGDFDKGDYTEWAIENMPDIVRDTVRYIQFGLSDDGHFVAYVPETWSFLRFDTVMDVLSPKFGRLTINF